MWGLWVPVGSIASHGFPVGTHRPPDVRYFWPPNPPRRHKARPKGLRSPTQAKNTGGDFGLGSKGPEGGI